MVRKKHAQQTHRLRRNKVISNRANVVPPQASASNPIRCDGGEGVVEHWLCEIRKRMPEGASLSATLHLRPERGYVASFKLVRQEEELSSEARADSAEEAVRKAGLGLCQHLPAATDLLSTDLKLLEAS